MKRLFLSYAREDRDKVDDLVRNLPVLGYQVWVDSALRGGQQWWDTILARIEECDALIAAVSPASINSEACTRERRYAADLGKPILPVSVEQTTQAMPRELAGLQITDYTNPGQDAAFRLAGDLAQVPPASPLPAVMPARPPVPFSYLTDLVDRAAAPSLTQVEQRAIVEKLEPALRSSDAEQRDGARVVLSRMKAREDLFADVERRLQSVEPGPVETRPVWSGPPPAAFSQPASTPPKKRSGLVTGCAVIAAVLVVLVAYALLSQPSCTWGYDYYGSWGCY